MNFHQYFSRLPPLTSQPTKHGRQNLGYTSATLVSLGKRLLIVDAGFVPNTEDGVIVDLEPGAYTLELCLIDYAADRRFSRLPLVRSGSSGAVGALLGETWTDTARTGLCDLEVVGPAWEDPASSDRLQAALDAHDVMGSVAIVDAPGATVAWVESGFGDGSYPVHELPAADGSRVGVEVEFIPIDQQYPFCSLFLQGERTH